MVYCGRPAASCARCRARKSRCDKATPACGQCLRAGENCPGYHDASTLRIRDETTRVIGRARILRAHRTALNSGRSSASIKSPLLPGSPLSVDLRASAALSAAASSSGPAQDNNDDKENSGQDDDGIEEEDEKIRESGMALEQEPLPPPPRLTYPGRNSSPSHDINAQVMPMLIAPAAPPESLHDLGISYFLTNYVLQDSEPLPGFLNYTCDILADPLGNTEVARVAICAVGLAGLASMMNSDHIMYEARASYAKAIKQVNAALIDSRMASKDSTISAVMVLGLFETITCSSNESLEAWEHHIRGMANLLIYRGTAQFHTKQGLQIFGEALAHVLTLCSRYGTPVPSRIRFLRVEFERNRAYKPPFWFLSTTHIEVIDLYHRVDPDQEDPFLPDEWEKLLSHAVELDQRLESLVSELPIYWGFKTVHDSGANPRIVYHNIYHVYHNMWVAKAWNGIRACRIYLNQVIQCLLLREGLMWAPSELSLDGGLYTALLHRVSITTTVMRDGILASVPQMLGFVHDEAAMAVSHLDYSIARMPYLVPASGAYLLLWYLFLAGCLPINTLETRAWVVDRLRTIRSATGIQKAGYLADILATDLTFLMSKLPMNEFYE